MSNSIKSISDVVYSEKYHSNWRKIEARMATKYPNVDRVKRICAIDYFKMFLILKVIEKDMNATMLSPSSLVDKVWHETLLDNKFYNMLCRDLFPKATNIDDFIINHDPDGGDNPIERNKRYENTLILMEKYFHEKPNSLVWEPGQPVSSKRPRDDIVDDKTTDEELDEVITIGLEDQTGDVMYFKLKKSTQLEKVMSAYAQRRGVCVSTLRFLFEGKTILYTCTPRSLEMEDNELVDVMLVSKGC